MTNIECPLCSKDDKIIKVSAILRAENFTTQGSIEQKVVYVDDKALFNRKKVETHAVPYQQTQNSLRARQFIAPVAPDEPTHSIGCRLFFSRLFALIAILVGAICLRLSVSYLFASRHYFYDLIPSMLLLLLGATAIFFGQRRWRRARKSYESRLIEFEKSVMPQFHDKYQSWQRAIERHEQLYYCERDDVIFVPREGTYAAVDSIMDYIFPAELRSNEAG